MYPGITTDLDEIRHTLEDRSNVFFIGMFQPPRPGVCLFGTMLEHRHFPPGTDANHRCQLIIYPWEDMLWSIIGVPREYYEAADVVATECKLCLRRGTPSVITAGECREFPFTGPHLFTLEKSPEHPVCNGEQAQYEELIRQELDEASAIQNGEKSPG